MEERCHQADGRLVVREEEAAILVVGGRRPRRLARPLREGGRLPGSPVGREHGPRLQPASGTSVGRSTYESRHATVQLPSRTVEAWALALRDSPKTPGHRTIILRAGGRSCRESEPRPSDVLSQGIEDADQIRAVAPRRRAAIPRTRGCRPRRHPLRRHPAGLPFPPSCALRRLTVSFAGPRTIQRSVHTAPPGHPAPVRSDTAPPASLAANQPGGSVPRYTDREGDTGRGAGGEP